MLARLIALLLLAAACGGDNDGGPPPAGDGGESDAGSTPRDGGALPRDSGPSGCPAGQHECGPECTPDMTDDPENGCRLGCGDPCPVPADAMPVCSTAGRCDFECIPPAVRSGSACTCEAATCEDTGAVCGMIDDGCGGMIPCGDCPSGSTCTDGRCGCPADAAEANDTRATAFALGTYDDAASTAMVYSAWSVSAAMDEDWYEIDVVDGFDFGNPVLRVELSGIPTGHNYDLYVWFVCAGGMEDVTCSAGMPDTMFGAGCASASSGTTSELVSLDVDCSGLGTDDSGTAWIRVMPTTVGTACAPYTLDVSID